jgi:hypothetical protein
MNIVISIAGIANGFVVGTNYSGIDNEAMFYASLDDVAKDMPTLIAVAKARSEKEAKDQEQYATDCAAGPLGSRAGLR